MKKRNQSLWQESIRLRTETMEDWDDLYFEREFLWTLLSLSKKYMVSNYGIIRKKRSKRLLIYQKDLQLSWAVMDLLFWIKMVKESDQREKNKPEWLSMGEIEEYAERMDVK